VKVLLRAGARPFVPGSDRSLLVRVASLPSSGLVDDEQRRVDMARALVEGGVDPCYRGKVDVDAGQWPSDIAERNGHSRLAVEMSDIERKCR
jgi:hypothetical protein